MQYTSKLFRAYERLHSGGVFEGTGIGLATVLHIVELHRGKVWAQGVVGKGATTYFQLPANKEEFKADSGFYTLPEGAISAGTSTLATETESTIVELTNS